MSIHYPLKFHPILHERIWGGNKLHTLLKKTSSTQPIGESWEISAVKNNVSVVCNGSLKGQSLQKLIDTYKADLVGTQVYQKYGTTFPLLIKFIDAKTDLSVQLHPNDELAQKRHNSLGKEEMWYIVQADPKSRLIFGFSKKITPKEYLQHIENQTLTEILQEKIVKQGDVFHIPTGRVHAIGGGIILAEIQQSSDITYRLYDWGRKDTRGKSRELHTDLALEAIDFTPQKKFETSYQPKMNESIPLVRSVYFSTQLLALDGKMKFHSKKNSFVIYMCVEGKGKLQINDFQEDIQMGESLMLPACVTNYIVKPQNTLKLLQVFIP